MTDSQTAEQNAYLTVCEVVELSPWWIALTTLAGRAAFPA